MSNTLCVSFFGGPSIGKSTYSTKLFSTLKENSVNCEYIPEVAKELTWKKDWVTLENQPYVTAEQYRRHCLCLGQCDITVTDSPFILGCVYQNSHFSDYFEDYWFDLWGHFNQLNFLLRRNVEVHPYLEVGRTQKLEDSILIDKKIEALLIKRNIKFIPLEIDQDINNMALAYTYQSLSNLPVYGTESLLQKWNLPGYVERCL